MNTITNCNLYNFLSNRSILLITKFFQWDEIFAIILLFEPNISEAIQVRYLKQTRKVPLFFSCVSVTCTVFRSGNRSQQVLVFFKRRYRKEGKKFIDKFHSFFQIYFFINRSHLCRLYPEVKNICISSVLTFLLREFLI